MLERSAANTIDTYGLLSPCDRVLVALSGGPDSVAMLHYLKALSAERAFSVYACHVNHMLRGGESDRDAEFSRELCESLRVPIAVRNLDVKQMMATEKLGMQEAARKGRYEILLREALRISANKIAVGQNRGDQAETVLMRIIRGTGLSGLGGIRPKRDVIICGAAGQLIRPLLGTSRAEILDYLSRHGLSWRTDPSNEKPVYTRNRIRLELMPALKTYNPEVERALSALAEISREEHELLHDLTASLRAMVVKTDYGSRVDLTHLLGLSRAAQRYVLRYAYTVAGGDLSGLCRSHVERAIAVAHKEVRASELESGIRVSVHKSWLTFRRAAPEAIDWQPLLLRVPGQTDVLPIKKCITASIVERGDLDCDPAKNQNPNRAYLDADLVDWPIMVRKRRAGDVFRPLGMQGSKKIKDFLISLGIEREERDKIPLVSDQSGRVLWVGGHRISDDFRVSDHTKTVLVLEIK